MARRPRFDLTGVPQHVVQRGNNRQTSFLEESDYLTYLDCLAECADASDCQVHAYVLMPNHVHLVLTPNRPRGISIMMQALGRRYVRYFNLEHNRSGTLWEGRYKACLIDPGQFLLLCSRYVELNPVRAALAKDPTEYRWSSHQHNAYGESTFLINPHLEYLRLGADAAQRQSAYRRQFQYDIDSGLLAEIRMSLQQELVLGNERFKNRVEQIIERSVRLGRSGRPARSTSVNRDV